jgi:flagellar hook-associated protein 3 FlgL
MRVSTRSLYHGMQQRIQQLSEDLRSLNEKVSSGKVLNRPSDNPIALVDSMGLKTALSQLEQFKRNIQSATSWLDQSESAVSQVVELTNRAQELSVQMSNATQSSETRAKAAVEVGHLLDQAIALGNTELGGAYIFSGYESQTAPFSKAVVGGIETAHYNGDTHTIEIQMGPNEKIAIAKNGQDAFMTSGLFDALGNLKKALEDNDVATIQQGMDDLGGVTDYLENVVADIGAKSNRLDIRGQVLADSDLNFRDRLSQVQDADYAEVAIELKAKEVAYQAALMSSVRLTELNLLNFMG